MNKAFIENLESIFCSLLENESFVEAQHFIDCNLLAIMNNTRIIAFVTSLESVDVLKFIFENKYNMPGIFPKKFEYLFSPKVFLHLNYCLYYALKNAHYISAAYYISIGANIHYGDERILRDACYHENTVLLKYLLDSNFYESVILYKTFFYALDITQPLMALHILCHLFCEHFKSKENNTIQRSDEYFNKNIYIIKNNNDILRAKKLRACVKKLCMKVFEKTANKEELLKSVILYKRFFLMEQFNDFAEITYSFCQPGYSRIKNNTPKKDYIKSKIYINKARLTDLYFNSLNEIKFSYELRSILLFKDTIKLNASGTAISYDTTKEMILKCLYLNSLGYARALLSKLSGLEYSMYLFLTELFSQKKYSYVEFIINNKLIFENSLDDILKRALISNNTELADFLLSNGANVHYNEDCILSELVSNNNIQSLDYLLNRGDYLNSKAILKILDTHAKSHHCVGLLYLHLHKLNTELSLKPRSAEAITNSDSDLENAISKGPLFLGESHLNSKVRKIIIKLIDKGIVNKFFLELPVCDNGLQKALSNPSLYDNNLDESLIVGYVRRHSLYEFENELPLINLIKYAYKKNVKIYFHDAYRIVNKNEELPLVPPLLAGFSQENPNLSYRNIFGGKIFKKFTYDEPTAANVIILVGRDHLYSHLTNGNSIQTCCGFPNIKVYDLSDLKL